MNGSLQRYPALAVQRGMVLQALRQPDAGVDVQQVTLAWDGPPDRDVFVAAWQAATSRHAVLRTAFEVDGDHGVVQVVHPTVAPDLRWRETTVDGFLPTDRHEPFDVGRAPLLRVTVLSDHHVVVTFHHAILDGRSTRMLLDEIVADYAARGAGRLPHRHAGRRSWTSCAGGRRATRPPTTRSGRGTSPTPRFPGPSRAGSDTDADRCMRAACRRRTRSS